MNKKAVLNCSSCIYFTNRKLHDDTCSNLGVIRVQKICSAYEVDFTRLRTSPGEDTSTFFSLLHQIGKLSSKHSTTIISLLLNKENIAKNSEFRLFQPVYIRYYGRGSYLSHFCKGLLLDVTRTEIRVITKALSLTVAVPNRRNKSGTSSVLKVSEFRKVRDRLRSEGKLIDPRQDAISSSSRNGHIPLLDAVLKEKVHSLDVRKSNIHILGQDT